MPSVCSESPNRACARARARRLLLLPSGAALLLSAGLAAVLQPAGSQAGARWRQGVFPVTSFAGFTSHYGQRIGPSGRSEPHHGLDIAAPYGSPIRNWWGGRVEGLIHDGSCGVGLVIRSGPYEHIYCHLAGNTDGATYRSAGVRLQRGQGVAPGQVIGHIGMSGRTTGPHLHWGIRYQGAWLDPARVLRAMAGSRASAAPKARRPPSVDPSS